MMKKRCLWIALSVILVLLLILFLVWMLWPTASEATGLNEYDVEDITRIVLVPRPGSGDRNIELTYTEEIEAVLGWFSGTKVIKTNSGADGSMVAILFYTSEDEFIRIDIQGHRVDAYTICGPSVDSETLVCLRPRAFDSFWVDLLSSTAE